MTEFTPLQSFAGGTLIGLAVALLMAVHGRVAGISGILGGVLPPKPAADWPWRLAFLAGMVAAPLVYRALFAAAPPYAPTVPLPWILVSGVMVGIGVSYGSGCTSGHGVCGLARFSRRSLAAVATFMATAAATVFLVRHVLGG